MKTLVKTRAALHKASRWDIDFHLPPEGIKKFPEALLTRIDKVARVVKDKRDPFESLEAVFQSVDIQAST